MRLRETLAANPEFRSIRRDLHAHPELGFEEHRTAELVAERLQAWGYTVARGVGQTGVVGTLKRGSGRKAIGLRADMDALPMQEANTFEHRSRHEGRMHACGHDGHVAIGAVAARIFGRRTPPGTVRVLFQPAEEGEGGAQAVIRDGAMEGVDVVLGVHLWNELPVGTIGVKAGPLMAAVDRLRIAVRGLGGHGGKPHRSADPIVAAAQVVTALQTVVSREVSPLDPAVVTLGSIHGGAAFNVIPDEVALTGTIRTFDAALRATMPDRIARIARGVAEALQCRAEVEIRPGNSAVVNDPAVAELARRAAASVVGEERIVEPEPTMGGEDMAVYFERAPGCFVFVGSANPARGLDQPHHSPRFDFDEDALALACEFLLRAAEAAAAGAPARRP
jgi:amidohydrolase